MAAVSPEILTSTETSYVDAPHAWARKRPQVKMSFHHTMITNPIITRHVTHFISHPKERHAWPVICFRPSRCDPRSLASSVALTDDIFWAPSPHTLSRTNFSAASSTVTATENCLRRRRRLLFSPSGVVGGIPMNMAYSDCIEQILRHICHPSSL